MTIIKTYISFDGKEFDDEKECLDYEKSIKDSKEAVDFFDAGLEYMVNPDCEEMTGYGMYMYIKDAKKARSLFRWLYEMAGFEVPKCEIYDGAYLRWSNDDEWEDIGKDISALNDMLKKMKEQVQS